MKKLTLGLLLLLACHAADAQCGTGCTTMISGSSSANYFITAGQQVCISAGGTVTGLITVSGGTLCNQGNIQTSKVLVTSGGRYENYGTANIDSLLVTGSSSVFLNKGHTTHVRMATTDHAVSTNDGTMTLDYIGDSVGTFYNNGNITVNQSFYNAYSSVYQNNGYLGIGQDFLNSTGSSFATRCMVNVGHDWYNSANITGLGGVDCGGFRITNGSYNSGTVTTVGGPLDLCDSGNSSGIDANTGLISSSVTYCSCTNNCTPPLAVNELSKQDRMDLFPNPSNGMIHLRYSHRPDVVEIYSAMGQLMIFVKSEAQDAGGELEIHTELLPQGVYLLRAKGKGAVIFSSTFIKE